MNLSCGIVGLPNVGKSTLFNALLSKQVADASNYPFCTIEPNVGIVEVPDERLAVLAKIVNTQKIVPAVVKFVDIAGLVSGASKGEGLGNKFLAHIRETDLIVYVLRGFEDEKVVNAGSTNPKSDLETLKTELILADLQTLEKQSEPRGKPSKEQLIGWQAVLKLREALNQGREAREVNLDDEEMIQIKQLNLLTLKSIIVVLNVSEKDPLLLDTSKIEKIEGVESNDVIAISALVESELAVLERQEKEEYLKSLGLEKSGLERLIQRAYEKLNLLSFLTAGEKEVRAWTVVKGTKAPQAAGVIHTDFEKSFIKAQVCSIDDFVREGGWKGVKEKGLVRFEGKEYEMKEGDVVEFMIGA